jgi:hypothetical protein
MNYLSPYDLWQLEKYGNIITTRGELIEPDAQYEQTTSEEAHIYELENPK